MHETFEWDEVKSEANAAKHGIDFYQAQWAFFDPHRLVFYDEKHSHVEPRWFCLGKVGSDVLTVRFTYRDDKIRIFGAALWRKGRKLYEQHAQNPIV